MPIDRELDYLNKLQRFEKIKPGLTRMWAIMDALGNPHRKFASIHISGTNGKGSTAAMLSAALTAAGLKTGLYTSPYLCCFNERIRINEKDIPDGELANLIRDVRLVDSHHQINLSFFEFCTAVAYLHFARQQVDIAMVEVGMGGANDATNVISPLVSIITNISLDHTNWLGRTTAAIACEKAGIIKPGVPLVTAERNPKIIQYFKKVCQQNHSPFYQIDDFLTVVPKRLCLNSQAFTVKQKRFLPIADYQPQITNYTIPLLGQHQLDNACLALLALPGVKQTTKNPLCPPYQGDYLKFFNDIRRGLSKTRWLGRMQIFSRRPFILLDGAHNPAGAIALARALDDYPFPPPDTLLIGLKKDKDPAIFLKEIVPRFRHIIATEANYQPLPAEQLAVQIKPCLNRGSTVEAIPDLSAALVCAQQSLKPKSMLLITGSLYLIGDTLRLLQN